ncbi:putative V-type proton ATPase subunit c''-like [Capsicum annuum]|nr:putative V-type proton ATPase subunit c''-like [Capsicum annuum]
MRGGRLADAYSIYKRASTKDQCTDYEDRQENIGSPENGVWKEIGNPSWKRPLPHILAAIISSFLFGYHLGVVNDTLESMSLDLDFSGSSLAEVSHKLPIIDFTMENLEPGTNSWSKARKEAVCALEDQAFLAYSKAAAELEEMVVKMVFESNGVEKYYETHVKSVNYSARVMKYRAAQAEEAKLGFVAHTDESFMSTIHQNQVNGLEIKGKDGRWFGVELPPSSVVVMTGDAIMVAFDYVGLNWSDHVVIDMRYFRPVEVDNLKRDSSKAGKVLGWKPKVEFKELVKMMVDEDVELEKREKVLVDAGYIDAQRQP